MLAALKRSNTMDIDWRSISSRIRRKRETSGDTWQWEKVLQSHLLWDHLDLRRLQCAICIRQFFKIDRSLNVVRDCTSVNTPDIAVSLCFVLYHVIQKYLGGHFYPHLIQKVLYLIVQPTGR